MLLAKSYYPSPGDKMRVKTRNGSFANQGHGGGLFNGNVAFGAYESSSSPISGLGEIPATVKKIPEHCAQSKAYTDCFNVAWSEATLMCDYCRENPSDYKSERRMRQDHHLGEPGRSAGPEGLPDAFDRSGSAGSCDARFWGHSRKPEVHDL